MPGFSNQKTAKARLFFIKDNLKEESNLLNIDYHRKIFSVSISKIIHLELDSDLYKKNNDEISGKIIALNVESSYVCRFSKRIVQSWWFNKHTSTR